MWIVLSKWGSQHDPPTGGIGDIRIGGRAAELLDPQVVLPAGDGRFPRVEDIEPPAGRVVGSERHREEPAVVAPRVHLGNSQEGCRLGDAALDQTYRASSLDHKHPAGISRRAGHVPGLSERLAAKWSQLNALGGRRRGDCEKRDRRSQTANRLQFPLLRTSGSRPSFPPSDKATLSPCSAACRRPVEASGRACEASWATHRRERIQLGSRYPSASAISAAAAAAAAAWDSREEAGSPRCGFPENLVPACGAR